MLLSAWQDTQKSASLFHTLQKDDLHDKDHSVYLYLDTLRWEANVEIIHLVQYQDKYSKWIVSFLESFFYI